MKRPKTMGMLTLVGWCVSAMKATQKARFIPVAKDPRRLATSLRAANPTHVGSVYFPQRFLIRISFFAGGMHFHLNLFAYNLVNWF